MDLSPGPYQVPLPSISATSHDEVSFAGRQAGAVGAYLVFELLLREALAGGAGDRLSEVKQMYDITEGV